jgi:hypothetical protein
MLNAMCGAGNRVRKYVIDSDSLKQRCNSPENEDAMSFVHKKRVSVEVLSCKEV